jgi:hypothetical protein
MYLRNSVFCDVQLAGRFQTRVSKAEADATCEHLRNRAGEAVLPGFNLGAGICFETQFRIPYVLRE